MPELPEVENVALALRACLTGRRLTGMRVLFGGILEPSPRAVRRALLGKKLVAVRRQGKYLLLTFADAGARGGRGAQGAQAASCGAATGSHGGGIARDGGRGLRAAGPTPRDSASRGSATHPSTAHLMIHLRMTGQLYLDPDRAPDKHTHLVLDFEGRRVCYRDIRKFGRFTLLDGVQGAAGEAGSGAAAGAVEAAPSAPAHVGPDMLEIGFSAWGERVARRRAPIKAVLLDQGVASGIGNIYADEALFRAGVHPLAPASSLDDEALRRIFREARAVMRLAIRHGGTTYMNFVNFMGRPGNFRRRLRVYQREGEPCPRCGTKIQRVKVAGRSSHFCPLCQPLGGVTPLARRPRARQAHPARRAPRSAR